MISIGFRLRTALAVATALAAAGSGLGDPFVAPAAAAVPVNCVAVPSYCGYPDDTTTGVTPGVVLKMVGTLANQVSSGPGWALKPGGWVQVTGNGAILSDLFIPYNVNIVANNVTLDDDEIITGGPNSIGVSLRHTTDVTIENSVIQGLDTSANELMAGIKDVYGDSAGMVVDDCNISFAETGVQVGVGLIENNYIHASGHIPGDHTNGIMSNGGTGLLTITHNTIYNARGETDAIGLFQDSSREANRTVTNNLVAGGAYAIYGGATNQATYGVPTGIVITGNRFGQQYFPDSGAYGPVAYFNPAGAGNKWSGNYYDTTGATIPSP